MILCKKCGVLFEEKEERCPHCGAPKAFSNSKVDIEGVAKKLFDTPNHTADYHSGDIRQNKGMACLSYISVLVIVSLIFGRKSKFVRFHAVQGAVLCLMGMAVALISDIAGRNLPYLLRWAVNLPAAALGLCVAGLSLMGIVYAAIGRAKEIPIAGWLARMLTKEDK